MGEFRSKINGIVDLEFNPYDQSIYYVNINTHQLHRISFGGNPAPVAIAEADKTFGHGSLQVQFDASNSYDPNDLPLSYHWEFGDGTQSEGVLVTHQYKPDSDIPQRFDCILTVTDSLGASSSDAIIISLNNSPPEVEIITPKDGDLYPVSAFSIVDLKAQVNDLEHNSSELAYEWTVFFHHNEHYHEEPKDYSIESSVIIDPLGCEDEIFWYRINLKVTDGHGLSNSDEIEIYPDCGEAFGELEWLTPSVNQKEIRLSWRDDNALDKKSYVLQKFDDQSLIQNLTEIEIQESELNQFSYKDLNPKFGKNIYRVMSVLENGRYDYSENLTVSFPPENALIITPNPSSGVIQLFLSNDFGDSRTYAVYASDGKLVKSGALGLFSEDEAEYLDLYDLPNGVYYIEVNSDRHHVTSILTIAK